MPVEFESILTVQDFYFLSGLAGVVTALLILQFLGKGM